MREQALTSRWDLDHAEVGASRTTAFLSHWTGMDPKTHDDVQEVRTLSFTMWDRAVVHRHAMVPAGRAA